MRVIFQGKELHHMSYCASCMQCNSLMEVKMDEAEILIGVPTWARITCPVCDFLIATRLSANQSCFADRYFNKNYYETQKVLTHLKFDDVIKGDCNE